MPSGLHEGGKELWFTYLSKKTWQKFCQVFWNFVSAVVLMIVNKKFFIKFISVLLILCGPDHIL
mgnify:FL=1